MERDFVATKYIVTCPLIEVTYLAHVNLERTAKNVNLTEPTCAFFKIPCLRRWLEECSDTWL